MPTLFLEYGQDFVFNQYGGLAMAYGWDEVRQDFQRLLLTNPARTLPSGIETPADNIFAPTFGLGLGQFGGTLVTPQVLTAMRNKILQAAQANANIANNPAPIIAFVEPTPQQLEIYIDLTLTNNQPGFLALQL